MQPSAPGPVVRRDTSRRSGHDSSSRSRSQQPTQHRTPSVPPPASARDPAAEQRARAAAKQREKDEWEKTRGAGSDMLQRFPADHPSCASMGNDDFDVTEMLPTLEQVQAARFEVSAGVEGHEGVCIFVPTRSELASDGLPQPLQVPSADQLLQRGISEYTILPKILGRGKFSTVFLAVKKGSGSSGNSGSSSVQNPAGVTAAPPDRSASTPSYYAIKHTPLFPHHALIATRLLREPTLLAELPPHPNLVAVYETVRTPDHFYLVEQYLGGYVTLEALLPMKAEVDTSPPLDQEGQPTPRPITLPMPIAESVFGQLISAVRACHHPLQICHRDIKPENILVHPDTLQLKLLDFGLATHFSKSEPKLSTCCGSPAFHCPEIVHALASPHGSVTYWGPEVDAWTCGVTMLRLLTGVRYPLGASHASLRSMSIRAQRALATIPDSPTHLRERVGRLLDMDSTKRMQALEEMAVQYEQEQGEPDRARKEFRSTTFIPTEPTHKMILPLLTGFAGEAAVMRPTLANPNPPAWNASSVPQTPLSGPGQLPSLMHHTAGTRTPRLSLSTANSRINTPAGSRSTSPAPPSTSTTSTSTTNASATPSSHSSSTSAATSLHAHSQSSFRRSPSRPRLNRGSTTAPTSPVQDPPQLPGDSRRSIDTLRSDLPPTIKPLVLLNPAKHPSQRLLSFIKYSLRCAGVLYHAWPDASGVIHSALGNHNSSYPPQTPLTSSGAGNVHSPEFAAALTMLRETSGGAGPAISIPNTPADLQAPATPSFPFPDSYNEYAAQTSLPSGARLDGYAHVHIFQCVVSLSALTSATEQQGRDGGGEESLSLVQTIMAAFGRRPAARRSSSQPSSKDGSSSTSDRSPSSGRKRQGSNNSNQNLLPEDRNKHLAFYLVVRFPRSGRHREPTIGGGLASPRPQVARSRSSTGLGARQRALSMAGAVISQTPVVTPQNKSVSTRPSFDAMRGESRLRTASDATYDPTNRDAEGKVEGALLGDALHAKLAQVSIASSETPTMRRNRPPSLSFTVAPSTDNPGTAAQHSDPSLEVDKTPVVVATATANMEETRAVGTPSASPIRSRNVSRTRSSRNINHNSSGGSNATPTPSQGSAHYFPRVGPRTSSQMPRVYVQVSDERVRDFLIKTLSVGGVTDTEDIIIEDGVVVNAPPERSAPETLLDRRRRAMSQRSQSYAPLSTAARRSIELAGGNMDPPARARHNRMSSYNAYQGGISGNESSESESQQRTEVRRGRQPGAVRISAAFAGSSSNLSNRETQTDDDAKSGAGNGYTSGILKSGLGDPPLQLQPTVTATSEEALMAANEATDTLPMDDPSYFPRSYNHAHSLSHGTRVAPSVLSAVPLNEETQSMLSTSASATASIRGSHGMESREGSGERPREVVPRRLSDGQVQSSSASDGEQENRTPQPELNLDQALKDLKTNLDALSIGQRTATAHASDSSLVNSATDRLLAVTHFFESAKHAEGTTRLSEALEPVLFDLFEIVAPLLGLAHADLRDAARRTLELAAWEAQSPKEVLLAVQTRMEELMRNAGTPPVQDEEEQLVGDAVEPALLLQTPGLPAKSRKGSGDTISATNSEAISSAWSATVELEALFKLLCSVIPRITSSKPRGLTQPMARMFPRTVRTVMAPSAAVVESAEPSSPDAIPLFLVVCELVRVLVTWLQTRAGSITGGDVEVRNVSFDILTLFLGSVGALIPRLPADGGTSLAQAYFRVSQPRFVVPPPPNADDEGDKAAGRKVDASSVTHIWETLRCTTAMLDVDLEKLAFERGTLDANVVGSKRGGPVLVPATGSAVLQHEADVEGLSALVSLDAFLVHVNLLARDYSRPYDDWDEKRAQAMLQASLPLLLAAFGSSSMAPPVFDMAGSGAGRRLSGELEAFADAALVWVQWLLDAILRSKAPAGSGSVQTQFLPDTTLLTLVNVLSAHAALSPQASARMIAFRCVATLIDSLASEPVGLALLRDLITDSPYPRLRASCVGLVRELVAKRIDDSTPANGVPGFATPALLLELGTTVFMLPAGAPEGPISKGSAKEGARSYFQDHADWLVEACGVYYFLIKRDRSNKTGIRTSTTLTTLDTSLLQPLRALLDTWLPIFVSGRSEDGVHAPSSASAQSTNTDTASSLQVLAVELTILSDALERAEQARDELRETGGVRS